VLSNEMDVVPRDEMTLSDRQLWHLHERGYRPSLGESGLLWWKYLDGSVYYIDYRRDDQGAAYRVTNGKFFNVSSQLLTQLRALRSGQQKLF